MDKRNTILPILASIPAWLFIQLVGRTNRIRIEGTDYTSLLNEMHGPHIFSLWHSRVMLPIYHFKSLRLAVIVSRSQDGEYITQVMKRFGIHATRGSASRHGTEGLLGLVHWLKQGNNAVVTPDGPRGPRETIQPGIIQLAKLSGIPITPVSFSCSRHYRFQSWDRFMLPLPFGTIYLGMGNPIHVPSDINDTQLEKFRNHLQTEMNHITAETDHLAGIESS